MKNLIIDTEKPSFENFYNDEMEDKNNFSYWYSKIKDYFNCPKTVIIKIPMNVAECLLEMNDSNNKRTVLEFVKNECIPQIRNMNLNVPYVFMKNAKFSNKFKFNDSCRVFIDEEEITRKLGYLNYAGMCVDALGFTEVVFREFIDFNAETIPTIYGGMPLRQEYRVFYNFDNKKVIHIHDYWDYDYVYSNLSNITDKIILSYTKENYKTKWKKHLPSLKDLIKDSKINEVELNGIWSMDFLYDEENDKFYLIDMAKGENSAYFEFCKRK